MCRNVDISNLNFINNLKSILNAQPAPYLIKNEAEITGLIEFFSKLCNYLHSKYYDILNESTTALLNEKIKILSYDERLELCTFFKVKSHFNKALLPSINQFCIALGIEKNLTLNKLIQILINKSSIPDTALSFPYKISCTNCGSLINTIVIYRGAENYNIQLLECQNCNHTFYFEVSNNNRYNYGKNFTTERFVEMTYCNCSSCANWRKELTNYIYNNYASFKEDLYNHILSLYSKTPIISLEQLYKIHKNSITKTENELLNLQPKNFSEIKILLKEMKSRYSSKTRIDNIMSNLLKHGIIYSELDINNVSDSINSYIDKFLYLIKLIQENRISRLCSGSMGIQASTILMPFSIDYDYIEDTHERRDYLHLNNMDINSMNLYKLNPYYFNKMNDSHDILSNTKYRIFNSNAELILFNDLKRCYPNCIISPNINLLTILGDSFELLKNYFSKADINYLKKCIIDFVISDSDGYIIKCIELQKGSHHDNPEWIYKDSLKKKALNLLHISFSEEF
jgi:hypothetical protein